VQGAEAPRDRVEPRQRGREFTLLAVFADVPRFGCNVTMAQLPASDDSLLVRTFFADAAGWEAASKAAQAENADGFRAYVRVVEDPAWEAAAWQALRESARGSGVHPAVLFVIDEAALADPFPVQVVDLTDDARQPFRCTAAELWGVDNNLNIANMDWDEFADNLGPRGIFEGFGSP
jgi:hypothetical protein